MDAARVPRSRNRLFGQAGRLHHNGGPGTRKAKHQEYPLPRRERQGKRFGEKSRAGAVRARVTLLERDRGCARRFRGNQRRHDAIDSVRSRTLRSALAVSAQLAAQKSVHFFRMCQGQEMPAAFDALIGMHISERQDAIVRPMNRKDGHAWRRTGLPREYRPGSPLQKTARMAGQLLNRRDKPARQDVPGDRQGRTTGQRHHSQRLGRQQRPMPQSAEVTRQFVRTADARNQQASSSVQVPAHLDSNHAAK